MENLPRLKVAIIEDNAIHYKLMKQQLPDDAYDVHCFLSGDAFFDAADLKFDIITLDHHLPDRSGLDILKHIMERDEKAEVIYFSGQEEVDVVVEAFNLGARAYIVKGQSAMVKFGQTVRNMAESIRMKMELEQLRTLVVKRDKYMDIIGESQEIGNVLKLIQKVERSDYLTMITGESGTGKELVAQAIHRNSNRCKKPFVAVNVSAIPSDLVESELFGHEKGAFTGADSKRIGKFEEADGGTLFLDEIGEMDMLIQTKLLRILQERKISRLGSNKEIPIDIRVLLATNRSLGKMVKDGKFREDLYYRIQGFLIHLPPLRERGNDVLILAVYFLKRFCEDNRMASKTIARDAYQKMLAHPWPGNVRELRAVVERAVLVSDDSEITSDDIIFSEF